MIDRYREAGLRAGHSPDQLKVGIHSLGYVADSASKAANEFFPGYARSFSEIGKERGWPPVTRAHFDALLGPTGALIVGDPETVAEKILHDDWVDIPGAPGTPPGPAGAKQLLAQLTTTFPDLKLTIEDILQDGKKVVVRARMAGTQSEPFLGFPSKNRKMDIQVVDIHEFKDGRIIRTWHTEDWMSGLRQLGVFER